MVFNQTNGEMQLSDLIDLMDPGKVFNEVKLIVRRDYPSFDVKRLKAVFKDTVKLYNGDFPGYRECNTEYHDLTHTLDTFLTLIRLINGYNHMEDHLPEESVFLGLTSALLHDSGYIQTVDDKTGTGAKYTLQHIARSIDFLGIYFSEHGFSDDEQLFCTNCILCTNINTKMDEMNFGSRAEEIIGKMLGIADLLGKMADRNYLEKLILLYMEFLEGKVKGFENELDLLNKTIGFFQFTRSRFANDMGNYDKYMIHHFNIRWKIEEDLYNKAIEKNIQYLSYLMDNKREDYHRYLRRDNIHVLLSDEGAIHA